jgi:organic radical activating enzyme
MHLVLTGGEPMLWQNKWKDLKRYHELEIETNGTIAPKVRGVFYSVSPKLSSSGNNKDYDYDILEKYKKLDSIWKFVIKNDEDWKEANEMIHILDIDPSRVYIMPEGITNAQIKKHGLEFMSRVISHGYNLTPRLQVFFWGNKIGV